MWSFFSMFSNFLNYWFSLCFFNFCENEMSVMYFLMSLTVLVCRLCMFFFSFFSIDCSDLFICFLFIVYILFMIVSGFLTMISGNCILFFVVIVFTNGFLIILFFKMFMVIICFLGLVSVLFGSVSGVLFVSDFFMN